MLEAEFWFRASILPKGSPKMVKILKILFPIVETSYLHSMFNFRYENNQAQKISDLGPLWAAPGPQMVKILKILFSILETSYLHSMFLFR